MLHRCKAQKQQQDKLLQTFKHSRSHNSGQVEVLSDEGVIGAWRNLFTAITVQTLLQVLTTWLSSLAGCSWYHASWHGKQEPVKHIAIGCAYGVPVLPAWRRSCQACRDSRAGCLTRAALLLPCAGQAYGRNKVCQRGTHIHEIGVVAGRRFCVGAVV